MQHGLPVSKLAAPPWPIEPRLQEIADHLHRVEIDRDEHVQEAQEEAAPEHPKQGGRRRRKIAYPPAAHGQTGKQMAPNAYGSKGPKTNRDAFLDLMLI